MQLNETATLVIVLIGVFVVVYFVVSSVLKTVKVITKVAVGLAMLSIICVVAFAGLRSLGLDVNLEPIKGLVNAFQSSKPVATAKYVSEVTPHTKVIIKDLSELSQCTGADDKGKATEILKDISSQSSEIASITANDETVKAIQKQLNETLNSYLADMEADLSSNNMQGLSDTAKSFSDTLENEQSKYNQ